MEREIDDLVANPQHRFHNPIEVLKASGLSSDEKRRILESWKLDASRLDESAAENMSGGEESELREVSQTLLQLKAMDEAPTVVTRAEPSTRDKIGVGLAVGTGVGLAVGVVVLLIYPMLGAFPILLEATVIGALAGGVAAAVRAAVAP